MPSITSILATYRSNFRDRDAPQGAPPRRPRNRYSFAWMLSGLLGLWAAPGLADVHVELTWQDAEVKLSETFITSASGRPRLAQPLAPGSARFPPLAEGGDHVLRLSTGGELVELLFRAPQQGRVWILYRAGEAVGQRFTLEIDPRPVFSTEVQVRARRRDERALDVPGAVSILDQGTLEAVSADDLRGIGDFVPNLDISLSGGAGGAPGEATVYLRGVGQIEPGIFADPGVGIYVDGMYIARSQGSVLDLLDVERVEVVRGPQGTLFGKNSTGGAIQLITRPPGRRAKGRLGATVGSLDRLDAEVGFEGPLSERWSAALALRSTRRDGYARSLASGETFNDDDGWSARGAASWQGNAGSRLDLSLRAWQERQASLDQSLLEILGAPLLDFYNRVLSDSGGTVLDERFITGDLDRSFSDFPGFSRGDVLAGLARFSHTTPRFDLLSISGYRQYTYEGSSDFDGTPIRYFDRSYEQEQDQWSQEIQVSGDALGGRLNVLVGGIYFEEHPVDTGLTQTFEGLFEGLEAAPGAIYAPPGVPPSLCHPGPPPPGVPCFGGTGNPLNGAFFFGDGLLDRLAIETTSWALFGEASMAVHERWSLSAGLRYTYEKKAFDFFTSPKNSPDRRLLDSEDWQALSPRLTLSFRANDDWRLYASAAHGFKSGGFNAGRSLSRTALNPYDQESLWAYEGGFKGTLFGRRLQWTGALFHYDYEDIQFASFLLLDGEIFLVIQNAAEARLQGFEMEVEVRPADAWILSAAVGHVDSEYTDLRASGGAPQDGVVPKTPEWTLQGSVQYVLDLGDRGSMSLRADVSSKSKLFHDVANSPSIARPASTLINGRILYAPTGDRWEIALSGTNLGDERYLEHGFAAISAGLATGIAGRPREWGLSVLYRF